MRQGDPLSCLLYAFSLEPLGHRLRQKIHGISMLGLAPTKLMMYTNDTNLFLSGVTDCLECTSHTIGCKFNLDKTDVLPIGSTTHKANTHSASVALPGTYTLAPRSALRILGVWIGSRNYAVPQWSQILTHIRKITSQWCAIGASVRDQVLVAKLLMQSRCYYLLDGNGGPATTLCSIDSAINRFMRGHFSTLPYRMLAPPWLRAA